MKVCSYWKVHLAYPASLQSLHSNTTGLRTPPGMRQPVGYLQVRPMI